jgi:hypothetical protein
VLDHFRGSGGDSSFGRGHESVVLIFGWIGPFVASLRSLGLWAPKARQISPTAGIQRQKLCFVRGDVARVTQILAHVETAALSAPASLGKSTHMSIKETDERTGVLQRAWPNTTDW